MEGLALDARRIAAENARGIWPERVATDYLDRWVEEKPDATAIVGWRLEEEAATTLSWRGLATRVAGTAAALEAAGVRQGDVVSFQLPNWWEFVALYLATVRLGAVANPLMPIFRHRELSFMLRQAEARVFVAPERFRGFDHGALARQLAAEIPGMKLLGLEICNQPLQGEFEKGARLRPNDVTQLLYTSGTTGESKGALHTSNTLLGAVRAWAAYMRFAPDDVIFMPSPLAHQLGFCYGMLLALGLCVPLVLTDIWRAARAAQLILENGATFCFAATPFLADLIERGKRLGRLRLFATAGTTIPPAIVEAARSRLGIAVAASWGMTECISVTATAPDGSRADSSDGCALPNGEVRIVGDDGRELPRGATGALQVRGSSLFVGYLKRPQLYRLDAEGWFDTGDLAYMDAEGYIRINGRTKDVLIRGGENVPVVEIEGLLHQHPSVAAASIVGYPDARLGERACAFIVLKPGKQLSLTDVQAWMNESKVAKQYWPERLEILEELPRTPAGKVQKFKLRELAAAFAAPAA